MKIREGRSLRDFLLTKLVQITIHQIIPCYPKGRSSSSLSCSYTIIPLRPTLHYSMLLLPPGSLASSLLAQNFPSTLWYKINSIFLSFTFHISSLSLTTVNPPHQCMLILCDLHLHSWEIYISLWVILLMMLPIDIKIVILHSKFLFLEQFEGQVFLFSINYIS